MDTQEVARGIVTGLVSDQIRGRGKGVAVAFGGVGLVAIIVAIVASGALRWLAVVVAVLAIVGAVATVVVRWLALFLLRRFAEPRDLDQHRAAIDSAIDAADLPTGPIAGLRFAWRLRRGVGAEAQRLMAVASSVAEDLREPPATSA